MTDGVLVAVVVVVVVVVVAVVVVVVVEAPLDVVVDPLIGRPWSLTTVDMVIEYEAPDPGAADVGDAVISTAGIPLSAAESATPTATRTEAGAVRRSIMAALSP